MILFSQRSKISEKYLRWLESKTKALQEKEGYGRYFPETAMTFMSWLTTTKQGKKALKDLYNSVYPNIKGGE